MKGEPPLLKNQLMPNLLNKVPSIKHRSDPQLEDLRAEGPTGNKEPHIHSRIEGPIWKR